MVKTAGAAESANTLTFYDVARVADVSIGTVSRVLNNLPNVDPNLRVRVLKAIDELGYIHVTRKRRTTPNLSTVRRTLPNQQARQYGSSVKEITLCVPVRKTPALQISYFYKILNAAQAECARRKIALIYSVVEDGPGALAVLDEAIQRGNANAILLVNFGAPELVEGLYKRGVPCIIVDPRHYPAVPMDVVTNDSLDGNMLAMKHLLSLGHRDIAFINGPNRYATQHRLFGYELALFEQGIPVRPELITSTEMTGEGGEAAIQELLDRKVDFTAVLCANNYMAFGALRTLQAAGKRVPEDISVVSFGDLEPSEHYNWPLTTINDFNEVKGRLAIRQLLERAANPAELPVRINLPLELVVRGTTAPVKQ